MNLSEFIEEALSEILAGVRAVQSKEVKQLQTAFRRCHSDPV
jgi:hypothetical protein